MTSLLALPRTRKMQDLAQVAAVITSAIRKRILRNLVIAKCKICAWLEVCASAVTVLTSH